MQRYLFDTNICVYYLKGKYNLIEKVEEVGQENCYISEITLAELIYGATCSTNYKRHKKEIDILLEWIKVLPIRPTLWTYAKVKTDLRHTGNMIDEFDMMIGATALHHKMIMVTENVKHLNHIKDLEIENWVKKIESIQ